MLPPTMTWLHIVLSLAVLMFLALYPLSAMGAVSLWLVLLVASYLIYRYLSQVMLLRRHAYIHLLAQEHSVWKQRLWQSLWVQLGVAIVAVGLAAAALIALARLSWPEWAALAASVLTFHLLKAALQPWVSRHIQPQHQSSVALRLSHWCNLLLLVVTLLAIHFWLTEVTPTSHLAVSEVMQQAYLREQANAQLQLSGWMLGINAALYEGFWHLVQWMSTSLPWWLTLIFWGLVMFGVVVQVSLIWLILLGLFSCLDRERTNRTMASQISRRQHGVWVLVFAIASIGWFFADSELADLQAWPQGNQDSSEEVAQGPLSDPCSEANLAILRADFDSRNQSLRSAHEQEVVDQLHRRIEQVLDTAYAPTDEAINSFLDWNFSLAGQYTQLAYLMRSSFSQAQFDQLMAEKIDVFFSASLGRSLSLAEAQLNQDLTSAIEQGAYAYQADITTTTARNTPWCVNLAPLDINVDALLHKSGVGAGVAPGLLVMSRALAPGSAVAARAGTRRMFASIFARFSVRAGSSATAASAGSVCGPLCMLVLGGATWIGTDLIINYGDERLNRADMFATLEEGVNAHRAALQESLNEEAGFLVNSVFSELEREQRARFNLSRELRLP